MLLTTVTCLDDQTVADKMRRIADRMLCDEMLREQAIDEAVRVYRLADSVVDGLNAGVAFVQKVHAHTHPHRRAGDRAQLINDSFAPWSFRWSSLQPAVQVTLVFCAAVLGLIAATAFRS